MAFPECEEASAIDAPCIMPHLGGLIAFYTSLLYTLYQSLVFSMTFCMTGTLVRRTSMSIHVPLRSVAYLLLLPYAEDRTFFPDLYSYVLAS